MSTKHTSPCIELVVFDWAGTTVDFGCFAPVSAFMAAFADRGVELTPAEVRGPMGLHKRDHIRTLLKDESIAARWLDKTGSPWTEADVEDLYERFTPFQVVEAGKHTDLIPGLLETQSWLKSNGIKIGSTTGYPRSVMEPVIAAAARQGYQPDHLICADEVPAARPAPWMIFGNMEQLGVYPPAHVLKVGDTVPDIEEGLNAGTWSVGLSVTGSEIGLTIDEWESLSADDQNRRTEAVSDKLSSAGAHEVITSVQELPGLIEQINQKLAAGERP
ncbi:MAG: phosphonoacetaldehyde hydrolase [Planctomycetaceae bacterium]